MDEYSIGHDFLLGIFIFHQSLSVIGFFLPFPMTASFALSHPLLSCIKSTTVLIHLEFMSRNLSATQNYYSLEALD